VDDKKKLEDDIQDKLQVGSGSLLAAARKQQGKTVEEIADELNLSVTQIRTIELDQSEGLPEPTYVRGYIRSYARLLDLNVDEVLEHYLNPNWQKGTRLDDMPRGIGNANDSDKRGFFTPFKLVFIFAVLSVVGFLWFTGKLDHLLNGDQPILNSNPSVSQSLVEPQSVESQSVDAGVIEGEADAATVAGNDDVDAAGVDGSDLVDNSTDTAQEPLENQLSLRFSDTSWVEIRDKEGNRLAFKSYAQGEDLDLTSVSPMTVFLGNAKAVSASVNGEEYDISKYREGVFARFQIGE